jgi:resuscitation-promoting factor RpfB
MDRTRVASRMTSNRWSARSMVSSAVVVIVVVLCGCGSTAGGTTSAQSAASPTAPAKAAAAGVALHFNARSYSLTASSTSISGSVTPGASVRVNGHITSVRSGRWSRILGLHLGRNSVVVAATMHGRTPASESITVTRKRSAAELEARTVAIALKAEARKRKAVEAEEQKAAATQERKAAVEAPACTNGTYVNSAGNTVCKPEVSPSGAPAGATAKCEDGTYSFSESRSGTCSHHGGVAEWLG